MNLLGIDYGERMIGLALSQGFMAQGLGEVNRAEALVRIGDYINKYEIEMCIIGLPHGRLAQQVRQFGQELGQKYQCPIEYWDETLTSVVATELLHGKTKKQRHKQEHQVAAALILESYLENKPV